MVPEKTRVSVTSTSSNEAVTMANATRVPISAFRMAASRSHVLGASAIISTASGSWPCALIDVSFEAMSLRPLISGTVLVLTSWNDAACVPGSVAIPGDGSVTDDTFVPDRDASGPPAEDSASSSDTAPPPPPPPILCDPVDVMVGPMTVLGGLDPVTGPPPVTGDFLRATIEGQSYDLSNQLFAPTIVATNAFTLRIVQIFGRNFQQREPGAYLRGGLASRCE